MSSVDEEQIAQAEPKEDGDYAGRQKKAHWIVYGPSVAAFTYCEQPQTVCSGSALGKAPEHSVMDRACWGRALCHPHLAWTLHFILAHHALALGSQVLSPSLWITGLWWPFGESSLYSSLQQYEQLLLVLCCLCWLPTEFTAKFMVFFFILIAWAQDIKSTESSQLQMLLFAIMRVYC